MPPKTQRFLVAPFRTGYQNDIKPWLLAEDAFEQLQNMYVWRDRIKKRLGSALLFGNTPNATNPQLISRLRIKLGTTDGLGNLAGAVPGTYFAVGQMFSCGNQLFTVNVAGAPAIMLNTGAGTGTYDTTNGNYIFTGITAGTDVYFYSARPVMGFAVLQTNSVNFERYLAFDQQFAYEYTASLGWQRMTVGAATWTGTNSDFFYSSMYRAVASSDLALFTTNFTTADGIRYYLPGTNTWTQFTQSYSAAANTEIRTARIVIQFKGRLLLFNTFEQPGAVNYVQYPNRCRYSQIGDPTAVDAWYDAANQVYGKGGFIDAPTQQQIVSAQVFRDRMIVYFERSTWELVYTNNEIQPFRWQNINIELGSESTFSLIPFDKGIMGIGEVGVHVTNGINVQRIDDKIPDYVFDIKNSNNGPQRVQGIRDYQNELAYWSIPNVDTSNSDISFPNQILVYNYKNNSWATWDDSITALGYITIDQSLSWNQLTNVTWEEWTTAWNEGSNQSRMLRVLAGNQEGYTFYITRDTSRCAPALQITDIIISGSNITLRVINHNLVAQPTYQTQQWILLEYIQGTGNIPLLNGKIYPIIANTVDTIIIIDSDIQSGTYTGGGTVAIVPQINILTKQYNFFIDQGVNFAIDKADFLIDKGTEDGQVTVNMYPSTGTQTVNSVILETSPYNAIYYPYEGAQDLLWHTVYPQINGSYAQFRILWNNDQMINSLTSLESFTLHAMMFYATPTDTRFQ